MNCTAARGIFWYIRIAVEHNGTQKAYGMKRNDDTTILYSISFDEISDIGIFFDIIVYY